MRPGQLLLRAWTTFNGVDSMGFRVSAPGASLPALPSASSCIHATGLCWPHRGCRAPAACFSLFCFHIGANIYNKQKKQALAASLPSWSSCCPARSALQPTHRGLESMKRCWVWDRDGKHLPPNPASFSRGSPSAVMFPGLILVPRFSYHWACHSCVFKPQQSGCVGVVRLS